MADKILLKRTAEVLNDAPLFIEIDVKNYTFWHKLFKQPKTKIFEVKRATLGTLINFSNALVDIEQPTEQTQTIQGIIGLICNNGAQAVKAIAILLENTHTNPTLSIQDFISENFTPEDYKTVLTFLIEHNKIEDFMISIIFLKGMSLMKTEEIIAPPKTQFGEQLEAQ